LTKYELFDVWAPAGAIWSPWVKPVVFAHVVAPRPEPLIAPPVPDVSWAPPADGRTAIVVDLPGEAGVQMGIALARVGYRPIPLYNAAPGPGLEPIGGLPQAMVDVRPIKWALREFGPELLSLKLPACAPPAFLLDANRRTGRGPALPGRFDNRSVSFPTDFPGANLLLHRGIRDVLLVQAQGSAPEADLAHTLRRWQEAGIGIRIKRMEIPGPPIACHVAPPRCYRSIWYRLGVLLRLRRNPLGGFGGMLPDPSASGG
jgi:hypothetical protein